MTATSDRDSPLVRVEGLTKLFPVEEGLFRMSRRFVHAVDEVDFQIQNGETLGLVGESGCGKTTTGRMIARLSQATGGRILLRTDHDRGARYEDVAKLRGAALRSFRRRVQMIFQDPYESLNPRRTVYDTVAEPLAVQGVPRGQRGARVREMLRLVGLSPPDSFERRHPHELSGGQRQRVAIARALVVRPEFVVADEPTSMLDVSIRVAMIDLMRDLADRFDVAYLYITHDLGVARYMCDRIAVMYLGKIVEVAPTDRLLERPRHPYTQALVSAVPVPDPRFERQPVDILGSVSKPIDPAPTCRFLPRCPRADDICRREQHPPLEEKSPGQRAACYLA